MPSSFKPRGGAWVYAAESLAKPVARDAIVRKLVAVSLLMVSTACTGASPVVTSSPSEASATPTATPTGPTSFTSNTYGYSLMLPAGWTALQASQPWDGTSAISSDSPQVDRFQSLASASSTGVAAPFAQALPALTTALIAATAREHGDTCPSPPESQDPITIGGDPGMLVAWDCGILINIAVTIHNGVGYQFLLRDPAVQASTDAADRAVFLAMLASVQFPD